MAVKKTELYSSLWASCDALRGGMDASQYKDYILTLLFMKYVTDKYKGQKYGDLTVFDKEHDPNPDPEVKNGIVNEDGELYYYVDGVKTYAGLIQIDGDYYYVNSYCKVVTNQRYWISKTNNLLPATFYTFDADGKMLR